MKYKVEMTYDSGNKISFRSASRDSRKLLRMMRGVYCEITTPAGKTVSVSALDEASPLFARRYKLLYSQQL